MSNPTQLYRLIEERLDGTLPDLIAARRPHTSWRDISAEIHVTTGIDVSWETLRIWFAGRVEVEVRVS